MDYEVKINGKKYLIEIENDEIKVVGTRTKVYKNPVAIPKRIEAEGDLEALVAVCLYLNRDKIPGNPA